MEHQTLLEKAKMVKIQPRKAVSDEHIELALAWMRDEIRLRQMCEALNINSKSNILFKISIYLREAYRKGKLKIVE